MAIEQPTTSTALSMICSTASQTNQAYIKPSFPSLWAPEMQKYLNSFYSYFFRKNGADEDTSLKGDSPSSTETDSGVSEGCSDNGMSTEEEDVDNASGGIDSADGTSETTEVELTEDLLNSGLAHTMKVCILILIH